MEKLNFSFDASTPEKTILSTRIQAQLDAQIAVYSDLLKTADMAGEELQQLQNQQDSDFQE